jgi:hypothetical protein
MAAEGSESGTAEEEFSDLVYELERHGHLSFEDSYSGTEGETWFVNIRGSEEPATKRLLFEEGGMTKLMGAELRAARDRVISYIYENGTSNYGWSMPIDDIVANAGVDKFELREVVGVLVNQGFMSKSTMDSIGLNQRGQAEAERLGPAVPMRASAATGLHIDARYSIVQVAGANSTQNATQSFDASAVTQLLSEIEQELPTLDLAPAVRGEAEGLLGSLKESAKKGASDAVARAVGGALGAILTAAGSPLGKSLLMLLGISAG